MNQQENINWISKTKHISLPGNRSRSQLTKHQAFEKRIDYVTNHGPETMIVTLRYDDQCGNGHNTFSITSNIYSTGGSRGEPKINHANGRVLRLESCGCQHDEIIKRFPELAPFIKWHLTSSDGPMHYIDNTVYYAEQGDIEAAQISAVWPSASADDLKSKDKLEARLPELLKEFSLAMRSLGFDY
jgi:hypothetical protein